MTLERYKDNIIDNVILEYNDIVITEYELEKYINQYLDTLNNRDDIYKLHRTFNGLLLYLYKHLIRYILPDNYNNDYELLDNIFNNIYIPLCYLYNHIPNIANYCILVHLNYAYFYDLKSGTYVNGGIVNNKHREIVKKWIDICNGELIEDIIHRNSIGSMFLAKVHGFREDNASNINITINTPMISEKQLQNIAAAAIPELPDNDT